VFILKSDVKYRKTFEFFSQRNFLTVWNATYMVESFVCLKTVK